MTTWAYRAVNDTANYDKTASILDRGFLWRPAFADRDPLQTNANVAAVEEGDIIQVGMPSGGGWENLGAFRVVDEPADEGIGERVEHRERRLAVRRVDDDSELARELTEAGYERDPRLRVFTGWAVEEAPADLSLDLAAVFGGHGQNAIRQVDEASAVAPPSPTSVSKIPFNTGRRGGAIGVDWSGAASAGKKIWSATLVPDTAGLRLDRLVQPFLSTPGREAVCSRFPVWLSAEVERAGAVVVGLDFCFSLAPRHTALLRAANDHPRTLAAAIQQDTPEQFKVRLFAEEKRATDHHFRSPFAPTNLRMFRQTHLGIRCLGMLPGTFAIAPWDSPHESVVPVVEVLPAQVVREFVHRLPYKGRSADARRGRAQILAEARRRAALVVDSKDERMIEDDHEGDALDAVLAALAALAAQDAGFAVRAGGVGKGGCIYGT